MTIPNFPKVTSEIVELVDIMRLVQIEHEKMIGDREGKITQHQVRRAEQAKAAAERKIDAWLAEYKCEARAWYKAHGDYQTDELPGLYKISSE